MAKSKGTRYTEEQILRILRELEGGASVGEVCQKSHEYCVHGNNPDARL